MRIVYDSKNQSYELTEQIGRGGEGTVFACPEDFNLVAKIYHEPIDHEKAEKLRWMAANQNERLLKIAAWIVDVLTDAPGGRVVGFLMPNVKAKEIHELYSLKSRRIHFPEATWMFLVHAATNVARAFYVLHGNEHIMGDVNHGNCVVLADGTVKLIDCDSYSISREGRRTRCEVGVATHLAPELQGKDLSEIDRLPMHDNFGLAVIIFQLLFLGRHPFAGRYLGDEEKSLEDCIRELRFAYSADAHLWQVKQPPGTLSLAKVSPRVAVMFERAFLTEDRPQPREWIEALEDLSNSLAQCSMHIGHYYFKELAACPWCEIETQTGLMLFPFVSHNPSNKEENFNIFTVENLLATFSVPQNLPAKPPIGIMVEPSEEAKELRRRHNRQLVAFSAGQFVFMLVVMALFGAGAAFFLGIILMIAFLVISSDAGKNLKGELEERVGKARADWALIEDQWTALDTAGFNDDFSRVRQKIDDYQNLQKQSRHEIKLLQGQDFQYRLDLYLAAFKLSEAKISGIPEDRLKLLENFGIRTAADIQAKRMQSLPPIGRDISAQLWEWRKNVERGFDYQADAEIPEADLKRFENGFAEKRRKIEREIESLVGNLRARSTHLRQRQHQLKDKSEKIAQNLLQSEADAGAVGSLAPLATTLVLMTTLLPIFGVALRADNPRYNSNYGLGNGSGGRSVTVPGLANRTTVPTAPPLDVQPADVPIPKNLTDKQIASMSEDERKKIARAIHNSVLNYSNDIDDKTAERKMRLAVKLAPQEVYLLNKLGDLLYEQRKYAESVKFLKEALEIDPQNEQSKIFLGINYLQMKKFNDAVNIFSDVVNKNPRSFEGNFNLGQAYKGLKDYASATSYLSAAVAIEPQDADAHYEYGLCLYKSGSTDLAVEQYEILYNLDQKMAAKLWKEIGYAQVAEITSPPSVGIARGTTK